MQSATEGQVSPPEQIQYGSYYIKEALMFPHCNACFVVVHAHLLEKVPVFLSQAFTFSVLQFVTEEMRVMSHCQGSQCHLHSSPHLE